MSLMQNEKIVAEQVIRIQKDFPDLKIHNAKIIGEGWLTVAILINDKYVFRMPVKHEVDPARFKAEIAVLHEIASRMPVEIPEPIYVPSDYSYFGYPVLNGVLAINVNFTQVERETYRQQWMEIVEAIQKALAKDEALKLGVEHMDISTEIENAKRIIKIPDLDPKILNFAEQSISEAIRKNTPEESWSFIHGDVHMLNALVDEKTHKIMGLLDWTHCWVGPLEVEFSIWEWDKVGELEKTARAFEERTGRRINVQEAKMWRHIWEMSDFVESYEEKNEKEVKSSKAHIERWVEAS